MSGDGRGGWGGKLGKESDINLLSVGRWVDV